PLPSTTTAPNAPTPALSTRRPALKQPPPALAEPRATTTASARCPAVPVAPLSKPSRSTRMMTTKRWCRMGTLRWARATSASSWMGRLAS
ncbi:hypothetical protein LTR60_004335, partial [Cryomyces antarcticus]